MCLAPNHELLLPINLKGDWCILSHVNMSLIQQELGPQHIDKSYGSDSELFKHRTMAEDNTVNTRETENTSILNLKFPRYI